MKKIFMSLFISFLVLFAFKAYALTSGIFYTNYAKNSGGTIITSTTLNTVRVTIYNSPAILFQETFSTVAVNDLGIFTVELGTGSPVSGSYAAVTMGLTYQVYIESKYLGGDAYRGVASISLINLALNSQSWTSGVTAVMLQTAGAATTPQTGLVNLISTTSGDKVLNVSADDMNNTSVGINVVSKQATGVRIERDPQATDPTTAAPALFVTADKDVVAPTTGDLVNFIGKNTIDQPVLHITSYQVTNPVDAIIVESNGTKTVPLHIKQLSTQDVSSNPALFVENIGGGPQPVIYAYNNMGAGSGSLLLATDNNLGGLDPHYYGQANNYMAELYKTADNNAALWVTNTNTNSATEALRIGNGKIVLSSTTGIDVDVNALNTLGYKSAIEVTACTGATTYEMPVGVDGQVMFITNNDGVNTLAIWLDPGTDIVSETIGMGGGAKIFVWLNGQWRVFGSY